ncbi:MAG: mechanosensitive ion channel family protein [Myxococcota bacterium]
MHGVRHPMADYFSHSLDILTQKLTSWSDALIALLPNFVLAVLIMLLTYGTARIARKITEKTLSAVFQAVSLRTVLAGAVYYGVIIMGFLVALEFLQLQKAVTSLLAGAGVIGLALSFAFQDLATNVVSGLLITVQRPLVVGDFVKTHDYRGHVETIGLRSVTIRDLDGQHVVIPSKDIFQSPLLNFSTDNIRRVNLEVGVSYASDLEQVAGLVQEALTSLPTRLKTKPVKVQYSGFGDSSIDFVARFWVASCEEVDVLDAKSAAMVAIKKSFDAHDITIPFPIRTLDFGIRGGERLDEVLPRSEAA